MKKGKKATTRRLSAKRPASRKPSASRSTAKRAVPLNDRPAGRKTWQPPAQPAGLGWPAFRYPPE